MAETANISESTSRLAHSIPQIEKALGISHTVVYELINAGKLRTYTVGRRRFCSHAALMEFIADREAESAQGGAS